MQQQFTFRLQRVLDLRERLEQDMATRLAEAREHATAALAAHARVEQARADGREEAARTASATACTVGELRLLGTVLEQLDAHAEETERAVRDAEATVERSASDFTDAVRDRRALDRLRDRHHLEWQAGQTRLDRAAMDAVALTRFVRRAAGEG